MDAENYYEVLGLKAGANDEAVKQAFRERAKTLHPDRNPGDPEAERRFKLVNTAYEALKDASRRRAYDEWLAFARKHERSRLMQWTRLAALLGVLLLGPSLALYWALVFLNLAGQTAQERTATAVEITAPPQPSPSGSRAVAARTPSGDEDAGTVATQDVPPRTQTARRAPPETPAPDPVVPRNSTPPAPPPARESSAPTVTPDAPPPPAEDATGSIAAKPAAPPEREEPPAARITREARPVNPERADPGLPRSLPEIAGTESGGPARNTPPSSGAYLPPVSGAPAVTPPSTQEGSGDGAARSMARMLAEEKEAGAGEPDPRDDPRQRQAALPEERRFAYRAGEPDDFADCPRCPMMSVVLATDFTPRSAGSPIPPRSTRTLAISKSEVTIAEWNACAQEGACRGVRDYGAGGANKPVVDVSREEAADYTAWLSRKTGKRYRPLKTGGGWSRSSDTRYEARTPEAGQAARPRPGDPDCTPNGWQNWSEEDCEIQNYLPPQRTRESNGPGQRGSGSSGFRVARTLGSDR
jgi:hypothetical protein